MLLIKHEAAFFLILVSILAINAGGNLCPNFPYCTCNEHFDKVLLSCNIQNKFGLLPRLFYYLRSRPIKEIKFKNCSAGALQSNLFTRTNISSMVFLCPFRLLDIDSLSQIRSLERLTMLYTLFLVIPPAISKLNTLLTLKLERGYISKIGNELQPLIRLTTLSLSKNVITSIDNDAFVRNRNLRNIDLSYNKIKILHTGILRFCKYVKVLSVEYNMLESIRGILLRSKYSLLVVKLRRNRFQSIENIFTTHWYIEIIDAGANNLANLAGDTFAGAVNVKKLRLDKCNIRVLAPKLLKTLAQLEDIDISFNSIYSIPEKFFHDLLSLRIVNLVGNHLITLDNIFVGNNALEIVLLSENNIKYIGNAFKETTSLRELKLAVNDLRELREIEFRNCTALAGLNLNQNKISVVEKNVFSNMKHLRVLKLLQNEIYSLNDSLQNLTYLEYLSLEYNNLQTISESDMISLSHLKWLYLTGNKLKNVRFAFKHLDNLQALKIADNKLETLHRNSMPPRINLELLQLSGNKWRCDCRLMWLREFATIESNTLVDWPLCHQPKELRGSRFDQLTEEDLIRWSARCPASCVCSCVNDDEDFFIKVDCSGRQLTRVPMYYPRRIGHLDLQDNWLINPLHLDLIELYSLRYLNLEKNFLKALDFDLPENLKNLSLANNNLTKFFKSPPPGITFWTLSNNPWKCDCKTVDFRKWMLLHHNNILDMNETRCGPNNPIESLNNKVITLLMETDLCPSLIRTYVVLSICVLIVLLFGTTSRLMYSRYHYHIKVWLYSRGVTWLKSDDGRDRGKIYDAFVSSADEDLYWVMELILPELESKPPFYTLFEPRRDMLAGEMFELEKEMKEVANSKRIIILLSESYIQNNFLMEFFKFAFLASVEEKTYRLILIIVGDLPPLSDIDPSLKAAIESTRCLRFEQKLFWEMLRFAMPKKMLDPNDPRRKPEDVQMILG